MIDNVKDLEFLLGINVIKVKFTKVNGDERLMKCTKNMELIPEDQHPYGSAKAKSDEVICVWDVESEGWRSFRIDSIIEWNLV